MTQIPPENLSPQWAGGTRRTPPHVADERATLTAFLDWHRATFELKCSDVLQQRLSERLIAPSRLSLHGLVRHLAGVERWWFRIRYAGERVPLLYYSDEDPDQDFEDLDGDVAEALGVWRSECEESRRIVASAASLDQTGLLLGGEPVSLRWILVYLIAEYARHNGHADLLRERIDGATGY